MIFIHRLILVLLIGFPVNLLFAQQTRDLENVEIEIVKERKIALPEAERKFSKIAPHASEPISPPIVYNFRPMEISLPLSNFTVRPLKLKKESEDNISSGQFSAGYGNYASPYLEGYYTSKKNSKQLIGAHALMDIWAKGPVDKQNSGNGIYSFSLFANGYGQKLKSGAYVNVDQTFWHFYGYKPGFKLDAKDISQRFSRFSLGGSLANAVIGKFNYQLNGDFGLLSDKFSAKETKVGFDLVSSYAINKETALKLDASYMILSREDAKVNPKPRNLFQVKALYNYTPIEKMTVDAGLGVAFEDDAISKKNLHLYPVLKSSYLLSDKVTARAGISGQMKAVSLHSLSSENPWLSPNIAIAHTNEAFVFDASIEAKAGRNLTAEAGTSVSSLSNLYFYINDKTDSTKFTTVYDDKATKRFNMYTKFQYALADRASASLRADAFGYNTDLLAYAWHRPTYKVSFDGSYNFYSKLKLSSTLIMLGGMKAPSAATDKAVTLKSAVDLSIRADYYLSEKVLIFLHTANLLNSNYNIYMNYPVRGVQVRAGFSWSF